MPKRSTKQVDSEQAKKKLKDDTPPKSDVEMAKYFIKTAEDGSKNNKLDWDDSEAPSDEENIKSLVSRNKLKHGDVVNFGDHRDTRSYIISIGTDSGKVTLVKNQDDSGSGYLTIPIEVLKEVPNFYEKYKKLIEDKVITINFHVAGSDKYLADHLGVAPGEEWEFNLVYTDGKLESFSVKPTKEDEDFETFDFDDTTWEDIVSFFEARIGELEKIEIKVSLDEEKLKLYKSQHSASGNRKEWMGATPQLPTGWHRERSGMEAGPNYCNWIWKFNGPKTSEEKMKENIDSFLKEFTFEYK